MGFSAWTIKFHQFVILHEFLYVLCFFSPRGALLLPCLYGFCGQVLGKAVFKCHVTFERIFQNFPKSSLITGWRYIHSPGFWLVVPSSRNRIRIPPMLWIRLGIRMQSPRTAVVETSPSGILFKFTTKTGILYKKN